MAVEQHLVFISWRNSGPSRLMRVNRSSFFVLAPRGVKIFFANRGGKETVMGPPRAVIRP
jgi:hypothetical protein